MDDGSEMIVGPGELLLRPVQMPSLHLPEHWHMGWWPRDGRLAALSNELTALAHRAEDHTRTWESMAKDMARWPEGLHPNDGAWLYHELKKLPHKALPPALWQIADLSVRFPRLVGTLQKVADELDHWLAWLEQPGAYHFVNADTPPLSAQLDRLYTRATLAAAKAHRALSEAKWIRSAIIEKADRMWQPCYMCGVKERKHRLIPEQIEPEEESVSFAKWLVRASVMIDPQTQGEYALFYRLAVLREPVALCGDCMERVAAAVKANGSVAGRIRVKLAREYPDEGSCRVQIRFEREVTVLKQGRPQGSEDWVAEKDNGTRLLRHIRMLGTSRTFRMNELEELLARVSDWRKTAEVELPSRPWLVKVDKGELARWGVEEVGLFNGGMGMGVAIVRWREVEGGKAVESRFIVDEQAPDAADATEKVFRAYWMALAYDLTHHRATILGEDGGKLEQRPRRRLARRPGSAGNVKTERIYRIKAPVPRRSLRPGISFRSGRPTAGQLTGHIRRGGLVRCPGKRASAMARQLAWKIMGVALPEQGVTYRRGTYVQGSADGLDAVEVASAVVQHSELGQVAAWNRLFVA